MLTSNSLPLSNNKKPLCKLIDTKMLLEFLNYGVLALASFKRKKLKDVVTIEVEAPVDDQNYYDSGEFLKCGEKYFVYHICSLQEEFKEYEVLNHIGSS